MASIRPFSGLRYDFSRAGDPSNLLAPPYDVVDDEGRREIGARSEHNCIHVILPEGEGDQKYANGADRFRALIDDALTKDAEPGYYVYHQTFESEGKTFTRKGFVALVELTNFGDGPVLAHERTHAGPKKDRLALMEACDAHLELVFGLFPDPEKTWEAAVDGALGDPVLDADYDGAHHTLYRVSDPRACDALTTALADKNIYMADGHHRYETMCTFRDQLKARGRDDAARYGMIYLSNLDDEGLVVLPTHRLVHDVDGLDLPALVSALADHFESEEVELPGDVPSMRATLIEAGKSGAAFGLSIPKSGKMTVLRLRPDFSPEKAGLGSLPAALQRLDVALMHELLIERGLGISKEAQSAKTNLRYYKSSERSLAVARDGDADTQLVCFMNATPVADVVAVCDSGEVMPQKSTFFFPKIPTGLVFRELPKDSGES